MYSVGSSLRMIERLLFLRNIWCFRLVVLCLNLQLFTFKSCNMYKCISISVYQPLSGETFTLPSMTLPDQVMSLKDLLSRHVRGQQIPEMGLSYDEDGDYPDPRSMDLTELEDYREEISAYIADHRRKAVEKKGKVTSVPDPQPRKYESLFNEYSKNGGKMSYLELEHHMDSLPTKED